MTNHSAVSEFSEAATRFFKDAAAPQSRVGNAGDSAAIWDMLEEMMFPSAWTKEERGGAGLSAVETGDILEAAGRHAFDEGLIDTIVARHWAAEAGLEIAEGAVLNFAPVRLGDRISIDDEGALSGTLRDASATGSRALVLADGSDGSVLALCDLSQAKLLSKRTGPRGETLTVSLDGCKAERFAPVSASSLEIRASAAGFSAAWIAGALRGLMEFCVEYANERVAFGRKISKFQAVQHHVAELATEVASAEVAARTALLALDAGGGVFECAAAKVRADTAGREGCRIAHQLFGAIGFTIEHPLYLFTGQIGALRDSHGAGPEWAHLIGRAALSGRGTDLWPTITDGNRFSRAMEALSDA